MRAKRADGGVEPGLRMFTSTPQSIRLTAYCQLPGRGAFWCALQSHPFTRLWRISHGEAIFHCASAQFHPAQAGFHCGRKSALPHPHHLRADIFYERAVVLYYQHRGAVLLYQLLKLYAAEQVYVVERFVPYENMRALAQACRKQHLFALACGVAPHVLFKLHAREVHLSQYGQKQADVRAHAPCIVRRHAAKEGRVLRHIGGRNAAWQLQKPRVRHIRRAVHIAAGKPCRGLYYA